MKLLHLTLAKFIYYMLEREYRCQRVQKACKSFWRFRDYSQSNGSNMENFKNASVVNFLPNSIFLHKYTTFILGIHWLMSTWVLGLLLLWTLVDMLWIHFQFYWVQTKEQRWWSYDQSVRHLWGSAKLLSSVATWFHNFTSKEQWVQFLHTLACVRYCLKFLLLSSSWIRKSNSC